MKATPIIKTMAATTNAGINDDLAENCSGDSIPQVNRIVLIIKPDSMLANATFRCRNAFLEIRANNVIGTKRAIVEIPTTIRSTIYGNTSDTNKAIIPKIIVVNLIIEYMLLPSLCFPHPAKSFTADIEIIFRKLSPDDISAESIPTIAKTKNKSTTVSVNKNIGYIFGSNESFEIIRMAIPTMGKIM